MGKKKYFFIAILLIWIKNFEAKDVGVRSKTILDQFYDYIQGERDAMEKEMENKRFYMDEVIMKIPKKSDKGRIKRSNSNGDYNIGKIKKEIAKLKDLIAIINDQKSVIDGLNDVNPNFNLTITQKELNDLRGRVKNLVGKLEKEIVERKSVDKEILNELDNQKEVVEKLQIKKESDVGNEKEEIINDVFEELKNLENHLFSLRDKSKFNENVAGKMRKSNLAEILENEKKEMSQSKLLKKLIKIVESNNKKKKEKSLIETLIDKVNENKEENSNKLENREENVNLNDRLDELKDEIDDLQKPDEVESKNVEELIKKLFSDSIKPPQEKLNLKKEAKLEDLIKKLIQKLDQKSKNDEKRFNLFNCKHIQPYNYDLYPNFGFNFENYQHPNLNFQDYQYPNVNYQSNGNYKQSNLNYKQPNLNYNGPNFNNKQPNLSYKQQNNYQNNYENFNLNKENLNLFHDQFENNIDQQSINGYNTQENGGDSPKNFVSKKLNSSNEINEDLDEKISSKRSVSLEENLVEILEDELKNEEENDLNENLNKNELDSEENLDRNDKERSRGYFKSKKITIFDKILNKIVDKAQIAIPKIIKSIFDIKTIFGVDLNNYGLNNFGFLGIFPMILIKLATMFNSFMYQIQRFPFIKNFLVPSLIVLGVSGMIVFLIWWLQPNNNYYYQPDSYYNQYKQYK